MRDDYCDINVVFDISLSMIEIREEMEAGFNAWLRCQKKQDGDATISLTEFSDFHHVIYEGINLQEAPEFFLRPQGNTALYDAVGKTIKNTGYRLTRMDEKDRPSKVLFIIITDGKNNCSRYYNLHDIQEMITHQKEKYSWEFVFLGANIDAVETGKTLGISEDCALTYSATSGGVFAAYNSLAANTCMLRSSEYVVGKGFFNAQDRMAQEHVAGN